MKHLGKVVDMKVLAHIAIDEIEQKDQTGESNGFAVHDLPEQILFTPSGRLYSSVTRLKNSGFLKKHPNSMGSAEVVTLTNKGWARFNIDHG